MNTLEAIYSRRSIRNFKEKPLAEAELKELLKSAYASPIGRALYDTLQLTVVTNKDLLDRWEKITGDSVGNPDLHPFYGAPTVILVSSVLNAAPADNVNYSNAAIVVQNMALAATELGIGACHIWGAVRALNKNSAMIKELQVPEGMVPCCALALGYFDGEYTLREVADNRIATNFIN